MSSIMIKSRKEIIISRKKCIRDIYVRENTFEKLFLIQENVKRKNSSLKTIH